MGGSERKEARNMIKLYCNKIKEGIVYKMIQRGKGKQFNYIIASKVKIIKEKLIRKFIFDLKIFTVHPKTFPIDKECSITY